MNKASWSFLRCLALGSFVLCGAGLAAGQSDDPTAAEASIQNVRFHIEPGRTRVWFETSGAVLYTHYSPDPLTLVIDLPGVDISGMAERTVVGSREVESVLATRLEGTNGKSLSRIEVKLAKIVPYEISSSEQALNLFFEGGEAPPEAGAAAETSPPAEPAESPERSAATAPPEEPSAEDLPAPIPSAAPARLASSIEAVSHEVSEQVLTFTVRADGRLNYTSFRLDNPKRLVFDFNGVTNLVGRTAVPIEAIGVARARIAQFRAGQPKITRLVFDLEQELIHRTVEEGEELKILFASTPERLANAAPSLAALEEPPAAPASPEPSSVPESPADPEPVEIAPLDVAAKPAASMEPVAVVAQSLALAETRIGSSPLPSLPEPPQETPPPQPPAAAPLPTFETQTIGAEQREYTGELISLDFKDGDIQDIFRLFADISGLNIVVQPGVTGRVTLKLTEVPWDQALELILKTHNLGYVAEGNVIRIAPLSQLADEEAERRRLAEEKALAGELVSMTRVLSYAKAREAEPLLRRNLSARGDIVIDERTNTVIVTDLADRLANIQTLIETLDTPIPGVEIEARIIVTTRNFARQLGIQWGFVSHQNQFFGNSTELVFPNEISIDGQAIGSNVIEEFKAPPPQGGLLPPQVGAEDAQRGYAVNLPFAGTPTGAIGVSLGSITGAFSINAALSAAERRGSLRIISAPKIVTQNNKAATIKQGVTFPVQVVANNTVTVQFKDAVLQLDVTPQITSADTIILDIVVNNDTVDFANTVDGIPTINTQSATTQVLVADGSTTVIGGVFVNSSSEQEDLVPLLHRIPILGNLFKARSTADDNRELLIFLTPRIRKGEV